MISNEISKTIYSAHAQIDYGACLPSEKCALWTLFYGGSLFFVDFVYKFLFVTVNHNAIYGINGNAMYQGVRIICECHLKLMFPYERKILTGKENLTFFMKGKL